MTRRSQPTKRALRCPRPDCNAPTVVLGTVTTPSNRSKARRRRCTRGHVAWSQEAWLDDGDRILLEERGHFFAGPRPE